MFGHAVEVPVRYLIGLAQCSALVIGVLVEVQSGVRLIDLTKGLVQGLAYLAQSLAHLVRV